LLKKYRYPWVVFGVLYGIAKKNGFKKEEEG